MKTQMGVGLAVLSVLAAEGKDFSREELNAMLDKLAASPEPKVKRGPMATCYKMAMPLSVESSYKCAKCGAVTKYFNSDFDNTLAFYRDAVVQLKGMGLNIALDESALCQKCRSARELGLPTGGTVVKRPPEGPKDEKPRWNVGDKVRIIDVPEHGLYRIMPVLREAWVSAKCISESGDVMGNDVYIRLSPNPDAVVLGTVNKAFPQLKRLPVQPNDPADWVRVEWPHESEGYAYGYSVESMFIGDLSYDEKDFVSPCRIDRLAWIINGKRIVARDDDAKILKAFLTGEETIDGRCGVKESLKGELQRLRKLLGPGESDPLAPVDQYKDVEVEVNI